MLTSAKSGMDLLLRGVATCVLLSSFVACRTLPSPDYQSFPSLETLAVVNIDEQKLRGLSSSVIEIPNDPVYKSSKRYSGVSFANYLRSCGISVPPNAGDVDVQFLCDDGYAPVISLTTLNGQGGVLAIGDKDAPVGESWIPFSSGVSKREPGPVYLVWPQDETGHTYPWPYGIVSLKMATRAKLLGPAIPRLAKYERGFGLFRTNCMSCHSVNGAGGAVGVDLNFPRNIFEYWKPNQLNEFVANAKDFRLHTKMPSFANLSKNDIASILGYIRSMQNQKITASDKLR